MGVFFIRLAVEKSSQLGQVIGIKVGCDVDILQTSPYLSANLDVESLFQRFTD
jgi:hypothetical protein